MGMPCPICGSRFTYNTATELVCRNGGCGARTPLKNIPGYSAPEEQTNAPRPPGSSMIDTMMNFGVR